ncbi:FprA family A-type flavoprotein [Candidatus Bipolaricaulota bacterium]|nr:FprA family A-type flavoprotein [Candidatus Bipolaricaulota bacterium]
MAFSREVREISSDVYWVGVRDWERKFFDKLVPLPEGTTYNAYLVQGEEKTALVDTVNPGFEEDLEEKVGQVMDPGELDYLIMNHAEPDHANGLSHMLSLAENPEILATKKGKDMALSLYDLPEEKFRVVEGGDTLDLGDKTLEFIDAPWLHWPETMFTYFREEGILFPSDFFGAHIATPKLYADEFREDVLKYAKDYFGEIMMPFRPRAAKALDKLEDYEINTIAPSHGVIYRNPEKILEAHRSWTSSEVEEKVLIPYISMWGSTAKMVKVLRETIAAEGVDAVPFEVSSQSLNSLAGELVDSAGIVFGTPTVLAGPHPQIIYIATLAKKLNPPTKYFGVVESHGWAGGAVRELSNLVEGTSGELLDPIEIKGSPEEEDLERVVGLGEKLVEKIK